MSSINSFLVGADLSFRWLETKNKIPNRQSRDRVLQYEKKEQPVINQLSLDHLNKFKLPLKWI